MDKVDKNKVDYSSYEKITEDSGVLKKTISKGFGSKPKNGDEATGILLIL